MTVKCTHTAFGEIWTYEYAWPNFPFLNFEPQISEVKGKKMITYIQGNVVLIASPSNYERCRRVVRVPGFNRVIITQFCFT